MIHVFPMLTSSSISPAVIPGISKALEMYILIYQLNKLKAPGRFRINEDNKIIFTSEQPASSPNKDKKAELTIKPSWKPGKVEFDKPDSQSMSLQPTWINVSMNGINKVVGVKVVSVPLKSDSDILSLLLNDKNLSGLKYSFIKTERNIARLAYKVWNITLGRLFGTSALSGNPKEDVILKTSEFKDRVFTLLNVLDIDDEFLKEIKDIRKLHSLGWNSLVFADDVNRRASFCMKEFKGLCTTVPYSYLFSTVSSTASKVFEDLTDVRKSAGPIFRKKIPSSKLIGEAVARNKLEKFNVINENELLQEISIGDVKKYVGDLFDALKSKDLNKVKSALKMGSKPKMTNDQLKATARKSVKGFDRSYNLSKKVLDNSVDLPDEINDSVAIIISTGAAAQGGDVDKNTKNIVKEVVSRFRKSKINSEKLIRKETIVALIFIVLTSIAGAGSLALILMNLGRIGMVLSSIIGIAVEGIVFFVSTKI